MLYHCVMALDIRTAFVMIGLLYLTLPTVAWIVLAPQRSRAVNRWCGGGLLSGSGFVLVGLRGNVPDLASHECANLLLLTGTLSLIQALRLDLAMAWRARHLAWAVLAYMLTYAGIRHGITDAGLRLQSFYVLYVVWLGLLIHLALLARRIAATENSDSARWIADVYLLVACSLALRQLSIFSGTSMSPLIDSGLDMGLAIFMTVLAAVVGQISYVGLMLDRSAQRSIATAAVRASVEANRRLGTQIAQLDRQRLMGTMAASLGHELTQPLNAILLSAGKAQRRSLAGSMNEAALTHYLDTIVDSTRRASKVIERIRSFIRPSELNPEAVDLGRVISEVGDLIADEARLGKVNISFKLPTPAVRVAGDAIQFSHVLLNVFRNAIEAMDVAPRRELQISLGLEENRAVVKVRDTGPGFSPAALAQAGTPFFTTKTAGLGLGLAISREVVEQFNGTLTICNADDGGGRIEICWPAIIANLEMS